MNKVLIGLVGIAIVLSVVAINNDSVKTVETVIKEKVGAAVGPEYTETQYFYGGSSEGSNCFSTSTTGTLTTKDLKDNGCIRIAPVTSGPQAALSLTLPATTTMSSLLPKAGSCRAWFIDADGVAAATTTTIVAGAGHNLIGLDATGAGTGADVIDGDEYGQLRMCRLTNGDVATFVQEYIHAD